MRFFSLILLIALIGGCATPRPSSARGVSAGVAFTAAGERAVFSRGIADPATGRIATPDDPARIASVSKLVVAIGVMKLVEQGKLSLDTPVEFGPGRPLRNPAFPGAPITLTQLLSHTSGLRDHDDQYVVPLGETVAAALAAPASWDPAHRPGAYFTYANLNFPVIAGQIELATGERFDRWMRREILDPLGIDACFNWPTCSDAAVARAIVLTQGGIIVRDDLGGRQPACPVFVRDGAPCDLVRWRAGENGALFAPQGGLRISVRDLARIGRLLLNHGELDGVRLLSPGSVRTLFTRRWSTNGSNGATDDGFYCHFGLSTHRIGAPPRPGCRDDPLGSVRKGIGRSWIGHAGEAYGLRSGLWLDPVKGEGIAYLVTGLDPSPPPGRSAFTAPEEAAFRETAALLDAH